MSLLVIAEHDNASLKAATLNAVAAATRIGGTIDLLVAGSGCTAVATQAATVAGVSRVLLADAPHYAAQTAENLAALVVAHVSAAAGGYSHVLAPSTSNGKNVLPRIAALLDVAQISDIIGVVDADTFVRPTSAGNGGTAAIETLTPGPDLGLAELVGRELSKSERPELAAAKIIVAGGRGFGSGDSYKAMLGPLADKLGAALGASRAAVDAGFVPNDYQVGQTGKIVAPQLYIAIGISGAIQHLAGMKDSKVIVAINKDPDAPIFQIADYGLVADLFQAVPELTAAL